MKVRDRVCSFYNHDTASTILLKKRHIDNVNNMKIKIKIKTKPANESQIKGRYQWIYIALAQSNKQYSLNNKYQDLSCLP